MEERRVIDLFDPKTLQQPIIHYNEEFRARVQALCNTPAIYPEIMAKIYRYVNQSIALRGNTSDIAELCTLLPEIEQQYPDQLPLVPGCDLLGAQTAALIAEPKLNPDSEHFQPLNAQIERLVRIKDELNGEKILPELLGRLIKYYEDFRDALCQEGADKAKLLESTAYICGIDLEYYEISNEDALKILVRTETGEIDPANTSDGVHPGLRYKGIYCKPNTIGGEFLQPGYENAIGKIYQLFNRRFRVATPVTLLKVLHAKFILTKAFNFEKNGVLIKKYLNTLYQERIVQCTMLSEGTRLDAVLNNTPLAEYVAKLERYSHCASVWTDILVCAEDRKAENILSCTGQDPITHNKILYNEGVDNDVAFFPPIINTKGGHYVKLNSIELFIAMDDVFDMDLCDEILEHDAIYYVLATLQLLNEDEQRFDARVEEAILTKSDLFEMDQPAIDRPAKFNPVVIWRMLRYIQLAQRFLSVKKQSHTEFTLGEFVMAISRIIGLYYQKYAARFPGDPIRAFEAMKHGDSVEVVLAEELAADETLREELKTFDFSLDELNHKTHTPEKMIADLLEKYSAGDNVDKQFRLLEYVGCFPIKKLGYNEHQIDALLMRIPVYMLPNALEWQYQRHDRTRKQNTLVSRTGSQ
ncbi:MAG: hypothetical protein M3R00_07350 [Pseudomonadota bacterium]|nr:hypothetical protein [Pseudomonadota bacterium]